MNIIIDKKIEEFITFCDNNNIELYLVGGYVRDTLVGKKSFDVDFALTSDYYQAVDILKRKYKCRCYKKYQAIKFQLDEFQIEISHCRRESDYNDYRHPSKVVFVDDIKEDSKRRDFTINALYYKNNNLYDFYNGITDLNNMQLKFIGNIETRIKEDAIRILRMIRFASYGYKIKEEDKNILIKNKDLLKNLSKDEYNREYLKIIDINNKEVIDNYQEILKCGDNGEFYIQDINKRL